MKLQFNKEAFRRAALDKLKVMDTAILSRFMRAGEQFVIDARSGGGFADQTGNLRSSIGYLVVKNGRIVSISDFESAKGGAAGSIKGKSFAKELAEAYPTGYALICVAGMEYAAAVESRGKDVITGSSQMVEANLKKSLKRILDKG